MSSNDSLSHVSIEDLRLELNKRYDQEYEKKIKERSELNEFLVDKIDIFLALTPKHDRSNCNE